MVVFGESFDEAYRGCNKIKTIFFVQLIFKLVCCKGTVTYISSMEEKSKKYEGKNSVIEFVEGWDMIQTLGEGAFGE